MKETYRKLCKERSDIPLFQQAWWLDATAGGAWDVVLIEKGGRVEAALPYLRKRRYGLTLLTQPALTQYLGPWLAPASGVKRASQLAREKDLMLALVDQFPHHHIYRQNWAPVRKNWMPFYWRNAVQTTRYSYRLEDLADLDRVWGGFQENIRREIRKARKQRIEIRHTEDVETFMKLNAMVFRRQGRSVPYSDDLVRSIDKAAGTRDQRAIFIATDESELHHAAVYMVWDEHSAYYLMGGGDPALRNSGATSLCMWAAIQFAAKVSRSFDFEGSMIEPVERYFRAFGGEPTPFFSISRSSRRWLHYLMNFRR